MKVKKHYKLYKDGKNWCLMALTVAAVSAGVILGNSSVNADATTPTTTNTQPVNTNGQSSSTTQEKTDQPKDNGNYGHLDSANVVNNNDLNVSGWQATNQATNKDNRYLVAYDSTTKAELGRTPVTENVARPDVAKAYPNVENAKNSGYQTTMKNLDWNKVKSVDDQIQIVSRYSDAINGEGNHVDSWSQPINLDKDNYAYLDNFSVANNQLQVTGWNATNQALGKTNRYVILFDRTIGREIARNKIEATERPDVAKVYPQVINAKASGFNTAFLLAGIDFNHELQVISRYSDAANGEGTRVDYWFTPKKFMSGNTSNQGNLDSFNISNGQLIVSGWHATDYSQVENNHYLILFDNTNKTQVKVVKINNITRPDVSRAFSEVRTASQSGFAANLGEVNLLANHDYSVVSRYSTLNSGNGDNGQSKITDYWFKLPFSNQSAYYLDGWSIKNNKLNIHGWMATNNIKQKPYVYAIILKNGQEIVRQQMKLNERPDVAKVYPHIYESRNSGFDATLNLPSNFVNGTLQLVLRFTNDPAGNGSSTDFWETLKLSDGNRTTSDNNHDKTSTDRPVSPAKQNFNWTINFVDEQGNRLRESIVRENNRTGDTFNATSLENNFPQELKINGWLYTFDIHNSYNLVGSFDNHDETSTLVYKVTSKIENDDHHNNNHQGGYNPPVKKGTNKDIYLSSIWINAVKKFASKELGHGANGIIESSSDSDEANLYKVLTEEGYKKLNDLHPSLMIENQYVDDPELSSQEVKLTDDGLLDYNTQLEVTRYTANLINSVRSQINTPNLKISKRILSDSSNIAKLMANYYFTNKDALSYIEAISHSSVTVSNLEVPDVRGQEINMKSPITLNDIYRAIYNMVRWSLFEGYFDDWTSFEYIAGLPKNFETLRVGVQMNRYGQIFITMNDTSFWNQGKIYGVTDPEGGFHWITTSLDDSPIIPLN